MRKEAKIIDYYRSLPYTIKIYPEEEGGFTAEIEELPGCLTQGETIEETLKNLEEAKELWIETAINMGKKIPLPRSMEEYSGKILLRLPKFLHRRLALLAKHEGISLNQLIVALLSEGSALAEIKRGLREIIHQVYKLEYSFRGDYRIKINLPETEEFKAMGEIA